MVLIVSGVIVDFMVDKEFLSMCNFKLLVGDKTVVNEPGKIVLTERLANIIFGRKDCLGESLNIGENSYTINGIMENPPGNSRFKFEYLISMHDALRKLENYNFISVLTYVQLTDNYSDLKVISDLMKNFYYDYDVKSKERFDLSLSPLTGFNQFRTKSSRNFILFISVSVLALLVSIVNIINSFAAWSELRLREIGIRKVMGATRSNLLRNMLRNSIIASLLAGLTGLILSEIFLGVFRDLTGVKVNQYGPGLLWIQVLLGIVVIIIGLIAGIFPAIRYSSPRIISLISGKGSGAIRILSLRKILVLLQYIISAGLLATIFIIFLQLRFLSNKNPGYLSDNRILITVPRDLEFSYSTYINELKKIPGINSVSGSASVFGSTVGFGLRRTADEEGRAAMGTFIEDGFFRAYGIRLIDGKTFEQTSGRDSSKVIIDRSTAALLDFDRPVGEKIILSGRESEIIGLVEDADLIALKGERKPFFYTQYYDLCCELIIHYSGDPGIIAKAVASKLTEFDPGTEYNFRTLEEARKVLYEKETNQTKIILFVGIVALLMTMTGAYSMASYLSERRAKQVSIRKVMGATVSEVLKLSVREMIVMIALAFVIASPISYFVSNKWLQNFTQRISIGFLPYMLAFILLFILIYLTVFFIERKSAMANPVDNLRQE